MIWNVKDTQKKGDWIVCLCEGSAVPTKQTVEACVDQNLRMASTKHHTATHLLHSALRQELGHDVHQAGSVVCPDYLRFDFTYHEKLSEKVVEKIESLVKERVCENHSVQIYQEQYDKAVQSGVVALFGEKYGDVVRVAKVGNHSMELCGGCHVKSTGEIGNFRVLSETALSAGVRRIVAVAGECAEQHNFKEFRALSKVRLLLNVETDIVVESVQQLMQEKRDLEKKVANLEKELTLGSSDQFLKSAQTVGSIQVIAESVKVDSQNALRDLAESLRSQISAGVVLLATQIKGKHVLACAVSDSLIQKFNAPTALNCIAQKVGVKVEVSHILHRLVFKTPNSYPPCLSKPRKSCMIY